MKNSKLRRVLLLLACAVMLVSLSVGATLAYLQSTTQTVKNTFTVGFVNIGLSEGQVWLAGDDVDEDLLGTHTDGGETRVGHNNYDLFPGHTYDKDPRIDIDTGSEDCYVVAKIVVTAADIEKLRERLGFEGSKDLIGLTPYVTGGVLDMSYTAESNSYFENDEVILEQVVNENDNTFYVYFKNQQQAGNQLTLFKQIHIPADWTAEDLQAMDGLNIDITAYAIQSDGFKDVKTAFAAGQFE